MSKLTDQIVALEEQIRGKRPRFVVVGLEPYTFKIAEWVGGGCDYYSVRSSCFSASTYRSSDEAHGVLVGTGHAKDFV